MQSSRYAQKAPALLAKMEQERGQGDQEQSDQKGQEPEKVVYVYPLEGGGLVFTDTPVEEEDAQVHIVDSGELATDTRPAPRYDPLAFLHFLLILCIFLGLDNVDTYVTLLTPTVTISITPVVKTVSTTTTLTVAGPGADVRGRVIAPLTITQEQTVKATGREHQDAQVAAGMLIFYNGSFASQTVYAGTVYTGSSGVQVATDQTITIAAANPPYVGQATVTAHAIHPGANGNIQAADISITTSTLQVKNSQFANGQDARDFTVVSKADIQGGVSILTPRLLQSEQAALTAQLVQGEGLLSPVCTPHTTTNHNAGDEAQTVMVTVSLSCSSIAYDQQGLQRAGERILTTTRAASLVHFQQVGTVRLAILSQKVQSQRAMLTLQLSSTWVYQLNGQHITSTIVGKPRLNALHLIAVFPGVQSVNIAGVKDNQQLPNDPAHIHLLIILEG